MFPGLLDERGELLAGVRGTHDESIQAGGILLPVEIGFEQFHRLLDHLGVPGDNAEAAAMIDIHVDKVERQQEQRPAIHDHHFAVVTNQIIRRAPHGYASLEKTRLQAAQLRLAAPVGVSDQRAYRNALAGRSFQGGLQLFPVHAEDEDVNALLGALDPCQKRRDAIVRLNQQLQNGTFALPG